jgi:Bax protein
MKNKLAIFYIIISIAFTFYLVLTLEGNYKTEKIEVDQVMMQKTGVEKIGWEYVYYKNWENLDNYFEQINYSLDKKTIPSVIVEKFPNNLNDIYDVNKKKNTFVKIMLPIINKVNKNIEIERENILNGDIDEQITQKYSSTDKKILLRRVQPIPVHIALGQSAKESGWGTSRFAIEGNNIFGEWTWEEGTGIVPAGRPKGETYEVKKFDSLVESMESYALKLNTLDYYSDFRKIRNGEIKNKRLTEGLLYYSQQREAYVESLSNLIDSNNFKKYNDYYLVNE